MFFCGSLTLLAVITRCAFSELIPRDLLFSNPKYSAVSLSPDGRAIGYLAPDNNGISNIFRKCVTCKHAEQITFEKKDIDGFEWTGATNVIVYYQDNEGDENYRLYKLNITKATPAHKPHAISDHKGVKSVIISNNLRDPKIVVGLNDENPQYHNIYEFNLITNEMKMVFHNKRFPLSIMTDNDMKIRIVSQEADDGSVVFYRPSDKANSKMLTSDKDDWVEYLKISSDDKPITMPIAFTADNKRVYWQWGQHSDLGSLVIHNYGHPEANEVIYTATKAQIGSIFLHPIDKTILLLTEVYHKPELFVANETILDDLQYLVNLRPTDSPVIVATSEDFHIWLITYLSDQNPYEYFLYHRWQKKAEFLFSTRPELKGRKLNRMIGFDFLARDNLKLQAYLSLPPDTSLKSAADVSSAEATFANMGMLPVKPQKLVLLVHGGPRARDSFGFSTTNAWLTSRNYAVLQVNFRGSTGFGKKHVNAGNGEWGRKMHYDLIDAVKFVVDKGIANRSEIAIMGGSYGGYAALVGMTFTPDLFACGVDIVGPSNLITLLETIPPYWIGFYKEMTTMLGADKDTVSGKVSLKSRSPLFFANRVRNPLMILQGANDPRVKQNESDQFVDELKKYGIPVTYILYPDEGHGFRRPENSLSQAGFIEQFLFRCLKGDYEEYKKGQYNSSAIVVEDAEPRRSINPRTIPLRKGFTVRPVTTNDSQFIQNFFSTMG